MADVAWFDSDDFGGHATPPGHPERQARWRAVQNALRPLRTYLQVLQAPMIAFDALSRVYRADYGEALADLCRGSLQRAQFEAFGQPEIVRTTPLDTDTFVGPHSWMAAQRAAGACVAAVRGVMQGAFEQAFCGVRPPGTPRQWAARYGLLFVEQHCPGGSRGLATRCQTRCNFGLGCASRQWHPGHILGPCCGLLREHSSISAVSGHRPRRRSWRR